jgi:hypothetical protein
MIWRRRLRRSSETTSSDLSEVIREDFPSILIIDGSEHPLSLRFTANPKLALWAQTLDLRPFRFTKNGYPKFFNVRSRKPGQQPVSKRIEGLAGEESPLLRQIALMDKGVHQKITKRADSFNHYLLVRGKNVLNN